jgi:hypothetical protein
MKPAIFLDMDGVLFNWIAAAKKHLGITIEHGHYCPPEHFEKFDESFWSDMEVQPWAVELCRYVELLQGGINIITRLPKVKPEVASAGKKKAVMWLEKENKFKHISYIEVQYEEPKFNPCWARAGDLLIDDFAKEIAQWNERGGIGFVFHVGFTEMYPASSLECYQKSIAAVLDGTYQKKRLGESSIV